jgi:PAP2 superfamily
MEIERTTGPKPKLFLIAASVVWSVALFTAARALDLNEPYLPFAIAGGLIFYLRSQPKVSEQILCLACSLGFALLVPFPHTKDWIIRGSSMAAMLGFGAFLMLGWRWIWSQPPGRAQTSALLAPASALVFFVFSAQRALSVANLFYPSTYDLYLYVADGSFGFQPGFVFGRAMARSHGLAVLCLLAYLSLPFVMALVYALRLPRKATQPSWDIICLFMLAGLGGWALYNVAPATGPIYAFRESFPWQALPYHALPRLLLERISVSGNAPRNAIPSLHMTWVLLLFWNTRGMSRSLRLFLGIYLGLTVLATLGTGEHYFVDLVAALPFALMVQATVSPERTTGFLPRLQAASSGLGLCLVWLLLLRYGVRMLLMSPVVPWGLSLLTCGAVWKIYSWFSSQAAQPGAEANRPGSSRTEDKPLVFAAHP